MKKMLLLAGLIFGICGTLRAEELRPQFRIWKSSFLGASTYGIQRISTAPIIFHMLTGSGTVNVGAVSAFTIFRSTNAVVNYADGHSTKTVLPLNQGAGGIGPHFDLFSDSHTWMLKTGGAVIGYEWDFWGFDGGVRSPWNPFPKD